MAEASQVPLLSRPTHPPTRTAPPAVTGLPSQLPTASQQVHGALVYLPVGQLNMVQVVQVAQAASVVELDHSVSAAEQEAGVHPLAVPSQLGTGAMVPLDNQVPGQPVPGRSGGTETSALLLTGPVGLLVPSLPVRHGLLGLLARLPSLLLPSIRPLLSEATHHTRLLALATR